MKTLVLASGNAGVMAATNEVVAAAEKPILLWVFGAVIALCLITFRDVRAASVMAPTSDVLYDFIGKATLGMDLF